MHFSGGWGDPAAARDHSRALAADLRAGRTPRTSTLSYSSPTVKDACHSFLGWQKDKLDTGEIGARWLEDCRKIVNAFAKTAGKVRFVGGFRPANFRQYCLKLAKLLGMQAPLVRLSGGIDSTACVHF